MKVVVLDDISTNEDEISRGIWMRMKGLKGLKHCQVPSHKMMIHIGIWKECTNK
jgi:hypothetical protein